MPPPRLRILLSGDEGCGKTCLIRRFVEGAFTPRYVPTIGVDYGVHPVALPGGGVAVRANIYDVSGSPSYAIVRGEFYRDADGLLIVVDVRDGAALRGAAAWLAEAVQGGLRPGVPVLLCGTKAEGGAPAGTPRGLAAGDAASWAGAQLGAPSGYFQASALTGEGVSDAVCAIVAAAAAAAAAAAEAAAGES